LSLFNNNFLLQQKLTDIDTAIANTNTSIQNANNATTTANTATINANTATINANTATQNANNKVNQLDNFDYETMTMGNYRLKNNIETDALDIEYLGGS